MRRGKAEARPALAVQGAIRNPKSFGTKKGEDQPDPVG